MSSYLEKILTRETLRENTISKNPENKEFDFHVSYDKEITSEAQSLYDKNKLFNKNSIEEDRIAPVVVSRLSKKIKKMEISQTTGDGWFGMKKNVLTPELKDELNLIKLRGLINPKTFAKKPDWKELPEYFQIGTVIAGGDEPKSMKLPKSERKGNLVDQFLSDDKDVAWTKNKFKEIQQKKKSVIKKRLDKFKKMKRRGVVRG